MLSKIFFLFSFLSLLSTRTPHHCIHSTLPTRPTHKVRVIEYFEKVTSSPPLRIHADLSNFDGSVSNKTKSTFKNEILPKVLHTLSSYFKVPAQFLRKRMYPPGEKCYEARIPFKHRFLGIADKDLILYFAGFSNSSSKILAWATSCLIDETTQRPVAGQVAINFAHLNGETTSHIANTLIHEILHVMGFDPDTFTRNYLEKGTNSGKNSSLIKQLQHPIPRKIIIEPNLVNYARKYFDCPTLEGVALQASAGEGSDDSHWLFENLAEEIMAPYDTSIMQKLSMFTLILMNSTGWWHVESKEDTMTWGKGKGCAFLEINNKTKQTDKIDEYCESIAGSQCTGDYRGLGMCVVLDTLTPIPLNINSRSCTFYPDFNKNLSSFTGQKIDVGSKCFQSNFMIDVPTLKRRIYEKEMSFKGQRCYQADCIRNDNDNNKYTIRINVGTHSLECVNSFEWVQFYETRNESYYDGSLLCPDIEKFCKIFPPECLNGCNGNGICREGKCICDELYSGDDCAKQGNLFQD